MISAYAKKVTMELFLRQFSERLKLHEFKTGDIIDMMTEKHSLKTEDGAASVVENIIVLPVVFAVIIFIIYWGQLQYQKALLMSSAERSLIYVEQAATDYKYQDIAAIDLTNGASDISSIDTGVLTENVDRQPYRYVAGLFKSEDYTNIEKYVKDYIEKKQIFFDEDVSVDINETLGLYRKVTVKVSQSLPMPEILVNMGISKVFDYSYETTINISQPTEMIRNTDFILELLRPYLDALQNKITELANKINNIFSKISFLNGMGK